MHIGIIGGGQLGQMLGFAARDLGMRCTFIDPSPNPPAAVCGQVIHAPFDDHDALSTLATDCDVVTYEFENVPVEALESISDRVPIYPPPDSLRLAQDRLTEKQLFDRLDIPLPAYRPVDSINDLENAAKAMGLPLVLKTRRLGYDGKGQFIVRDRADLETAWRQLGESDLIAEEWVDFDFEVSAIGARNATGEFITYPLTQNEHVDGILRISRAPLDDESLTQRAGKIMAALLESLDYVGVLALELFVVGDRLLANELAPRVHNSGHWSIEGAVPSQFTSHLIAISNGHLEAPRVRGYAGMLNLIGEIPAAAHNLPGSHLHDYGKDSRPGRKLGHITVIADSAVERDRLLAEIGEKTG